MNAICATDTGLPALVTEWKAAFQAWEDESGKPGSEDFDTPECLRLEAIRDELTEKLEAAKPRTLEDVVALLEFLWICDAGDYVGDYISAKKCVFRNILESSPVSTVRQSASS